MSRRLFLVALTVCLLPATASAALPTFPDHRIVLGQSIGGVRVGMTTAQAIAKWGATDGCPASLTDGSCEWVSPKEGFASVSLRNGIVITVGIRMSTDSKGIPIFKGPLMKLKTTKKIGMKATIRDILKAYPKFSGTSLSTSPHLTNFATSGGRVYDIFVGRQP